MIRPKLRALAGALTLAAALALPATAAAAPPANDAFATPAALTGATATGTNVEATSEAGDPAQANGASVWWTWTAPSTAVYTIDTCGSDFDTILAVYTGGTLATLALRGTDDDGAACGGATSSVSFSAVGSTVYRIMVDGYDPEFGDTGAINLNVTEGGTVAPAPANDDFANATEIVSNTATVTGSNAGATKEAGEPNHAGNSGGASVWWKWTPGSDTPIAMRTCDTAGGMDTTLAVYTGSAVGSLTMVASDDDNWNVCTANDLASYVEFNAVGGTTYYIAVDGFSGETGDITLQLSAPVVDRDGDGVATSEDCAPDDSTRPATGGTDANCNGVVDSTEDADGDGIANGSDCAPADGARPNRTGTDSNCNGVVDSSEDADGDGLANGADCAPNDAAKPNRNGTDANCDGVIDVVSLTFIGNATSRTFTGAALADLFRGGIGSETFRGMGGNDRGFGNRGNDKLYGGRGNDFGDGGPGTDYVFGEAGNDSSYGGAGNDIVNGGVGTDLSRGGYGNDRVFCGTGLRDRAFGDAGDDSLNCYDRSGGDLVDGGLGRRDVCVGDRRDIFRNCERIVRR